MRLMVIGKIGQQPGLTYRSCFPAMNCASSAVLPSLPPVWTGCPDTSLLLPVLPLPVADEGRSVWDSEERCDNMPQRWVLI